MNNQHIPIKNIKQHIDIYTKLIRNLFNNMVDDQSKKADVTPIYKKVKTTNTCKYRSDSILSTMLKVFLKIILYTNKNIFHNICLITYAVLNYNHGQKLWQNGKKTAMFLTPQSM